MLRESVIRNNSSIGGSSGSHYYPTNLNSLGHGICVHQKNISAAEGLEPGTPGLRASPATNEFRGIYIPLLGPLRGLGGTLPMPWRCPPIYLTLYAPGRVPLGIPTGTGRAPVTSPLIAGRHPPGPARIPAGYL